MVKGGRMSYTRQQNYSFCRLLPAVQLIWATKINPDGHTKPVSYPAGFRPES